MALTGTQAYILSKSLTASVVSGIRTMYFDSNGDLVIECIDGTILKRSFMDIKKIEFVEETDGKHLVIEYTNNTKNDLGVFDPKFDINDLISVGTTADEATATTPLFINIEQSNDNSSSGGSGVSIADSNDLNNLWT